MFVPLTPLDFLDRARRYFGHRPGVITDEQSVTYEEFADDCSRLAGLLAGRGVRQYDRVAWLGNNSYELLCAYYAVPMLGAILVPVNIRLTTADTQLVVRDSDPTLVVAESGYADRVDDPVVVDDSFAADWRSAPMASRADVSETDVAEIFYTSGSTGRPKGVTWTHRALYLHAVHSALTTGFTPDDVFLTTIPLFHVNGWGVPHYATGLGAQQVVMPFSASRVVDAIQAHGVTRLFLVPTMARSVLDEVEAQSVTLDSVRGISVGGAPVTPALLEELELTFGCQTICGYGLTETSTLTRSHPLPGEEATAETRRSIGMPVIGASVRVVGGDGVDVEPGSGQSGEVIARSNHVTNNYWRESGDDASFSDGWFHTGDLATIGADGYLRIVDRKKDLIISGGENISSVEIEALLKDHPMVTEAAVVGQPDPRWGETPVAWVEVDGELTAADVADWLSSRIAKFMMPAGIGVVDKLPTGGTGKIQKPVVRSWGTPDPSLGAWARS